MKRILIAGSRDFDNYAMMERIFFGIIEDWPLDDVVIVTGMAPGADTLGYDMAAEWNMNTAEFHADWDNINAPGAVVKKNRNGKKYNAVAGHWRNQAMADFLDEQDDSHAILFWDGKSKGTKDMLKRLTKAKIDTDIRYF